MEDVVCLYFLQVEVEVLHEVNDVVGYNWLLLSEDLLEHWVLGGIGHCLVLADE